MSREEILQGTRRLIELIEQEHIEISKCIENEILKEYQMLLRKEVRQLQEYLYLLNKFYS